MLTYSAPVEISKTVDDDYIFAATQTHHTMMGREIVKETTLKTYIKDPNAGNDPELVGSRKKVKIYRRKRRKK